MAIDKARIKWRAYAVYLLVSLAVMLPLLKPGFILTLDMVFTPTLRMPQAITSSYLFHAGLHALNVIIPSDVIEKLLLLAILLLSSIGMHRLLVALKTDRVEEWGMYVASVFFAINPFTYSRFMAGQYAVLLGYALLPWCVRLLIAFAAHPGWSTTLRLGLLTTLIGVISIHTLGLVAVLVAAGASVGVWRRRNRLKQYTAYGLVAGGLFVLLSVYWIVPLALGQGQTAQQIQQFTAADTQAFATTGGSPLGRLGNVARLQGFWAEGRDLYLLPQDRMILWGLMMLAIIGLVIVGGVALWPRQRSLVLWLSLTTVVALLLAIGLFSPLLSRIGLREPHKFVGLVALIYSIYMAAGVTTVLQKIRTAWSEIGYAAATTVTLLLPLLIMRVMLWGFDGQLSPRQYPPEWATANQQLRADPDHFTVLFLPWHQYMSFDFAGRIIANPAPDYFDQPMVVSVNPELDNATSGRQDQRHQTLTQLLANAKNSKDFGRQLSLQNIKYVLLAREVDFKDYDYLNRTAGLTKVADYNSLVLYQNNTWREQP